MKAPRFEELAQRWAGKAEVYYVFSDEAHPRAAANERLNGFASQLEKLDRDGDGQVTLAEYGTFGPRFMFDAFDLDRDGVVKSYELLAARRIEQFKDVDDAKTVEARVALANKFRAEVPGRIRILIDPIGEPTAKAYGQLPNAAYVIGADRKVTKKIAWAAVGEVERELARLTGAPPPIVREPDLAPIAAQMDAAAKAKQRLLVELVAPGCEPCRRTDVTLADPEVAAALKPFAVARLSIDADTNWRLFEQLDLAATPAFVIVEPDGKLGPHTQGYQDRGKLLAFLGR